MYFFFKQKTAYEILAWLEFRRVLLPILSKGPPRPAEAATMSARPIVDSTRGLEEDLRRFRAGIPAAPRALGGGAATRDALRSEERRVGKECRSRWSRYH